MESQKHRPLGVTLIAILTIIGGIIFLARGQVHLKIGIGNILLSIGKAYIVKSYRLWKGKGWAWTITLILSAIGIVVALVSIAFGNVAAIINVIIHGIVIYYLYRPNVKAFFGK